MKKPVHCFLRKKDTLKTLLVLKLTFILLTAFMLQLSATGLSQNISFSGRNVPLEKVFADVKRQTGTVFFYDLDVLKRSGPVTMDVKNVTLEVFLGLAFKDKPLKYIIRSNSVVVFPHDEEKKDGKEELQKVTGRVTDEEGSPLAGATVAVKSREFATVGMTDMNGVFITSGYVGDTITISFVGFRPYVYRIQKQNKTLNVVLGKSSAAMNEVTIRTGFQAISKERVAGAYTRVDGEDLRQKSNSINIIDRIEGLAPGLSVNYGEGNDKFLIRGVNSVNANRAPLYVIDGVPMPYDDISRLINANDVQDVVLLKDATATSIWGAQAANGVVVITTKKGRSSGKIKVQYNGFASFRGLPDHSYQKMMNGRQFIRAAKEVFDPAVFPFSYVSTINPNFQLPVVYPHEQVLYDLENGLISSIVADQRLDSLATLDNRSQIDGYIRQPGFLTNSSASFSGGTPFYSFYGSLNHTLQKNVDRSNQGIYMVNFRQNFSFTPFLKLDITTNVSQENIKKFTIPQLPELSTYLPYAMFHGVGGPLSQSYLQLYEAYQENAEDRSGIGLDYIPLNEAEYAGRNGNNTLTARINAGLTISFLDNFSFEGRYQYTNGNNNNYQYYDQNSYLTRREVVSFTQPGPVYNMPSQGGHYYTGNGSNVAWTMRNQVSYNNSWNDREHQVTMLAGTELRNDLVKASSRLIRGYDYQTMTYQPFDEKSLAQGMVDPVIPNYYDISLLLGQSYAAQEAETRFFSLYSNLAYAFKRKYNLNASLRMDQSNLFGTDVSQQYKPIWSVGGSWQISNEPFFRSELINDLKLRLTYGIGGNSPNPGSGGPYDIITPFSNPFYNNVGLGYYVIRPSNDKLIWERTATLNAGIDMSLIRDRLSLTLDVYNKKTSDLLATVPFDPTNGWVNGYTNLGDIENKGVEIGIQSSNIQTNDFGWTTNFNLGYNHNKVVKLNQLVPLDAFGKLNSLGFVEGYSAYSLFALKWAGLDNAGNPQVFNAKGEKIRFLNELSLNDVHYAGTSQPLYYGGITNQFRYRSWELSFLVVYNLGHKMRSYVNQFYSGRLTNNTSYLFFDRWQKPGDEAFTNVPAYIADPNISASARELSFYTRADINIVSASYMKMRDITLSYNVPVSWAGRLAMENLRIYVQANNMMLWAANGEDLDPEYYNLGNGVGTSQGAGSGSSLGGAPRFSIPNRMKPFFTFGLNVSFK